MEDYRELLNDLQEPQWLIEMRAHYYKHGNYRAGDLRRVLGDPSKGVSSNPEEMRRLFLKNQ